jgi:FeS assembly SUF system protein
MEGSPLDNLNAKATEALVVEVLRAIYDPELPVNIYDLGLIYGIEVGPDDVVTIRMTLTTPACPMAEMLPAEVESRVKAIDSVKDARVELVWDPPWTPERMSEAARLASGLM